MAINQNITFNTTTTVKAWEAMESIASTEQLKVSPSLCSVWGSIYRKFESLNIRICEPTLFRNRGQFYRVEWSLQDMENCEVLGTMVFGSDPCLNTHPVPKFWIRLKDEVSANDVHNEIFLVNGFQDKMFFYSLYEAHTLNKKALTYCCK